jgi:anti-sigma factor RsiW
MTKPLTPECATVLSGISAYLDGELPSTQCDAIDAHCATCPDCATVVQGLRETIGLCRGVSVAALPAPVKEKAQASIAALLKTGRL